MKLALEPSGGPARVGYMLLVVVVLAAAVAPAVAPARPSAQFADRAYAPPTRIHVFDEQGWRAPFAYRLEVVDRLSRQYREDRSSSASLQWFRDGRLVGLPEAEGPLLLLGADALGRDVLSRTLHGARRSLGVAAVGVLGALVLGMLIGGLAGTCGGRVEAALMWLADLLLALPAVYLVLVLRGVLPPVLTVWQVFWLMAVFFAFAAWPHVARGVRGIVAAERRKDYAEAARAAGAGPLRLLAQLLPAARGFLAVEIVLLLPALLVAEATISYLGLGFPDASASWGTLLQDAANVRVLAEAPWMLAPAAAMFVVVLAAQLATRRQAAGL